LHTIMEWNDQVSVVTLTLARMTIFLTLNGKFFLDNVKKEFKVQSSRR